MRKKGGGISGEGTATQRPLKLLAIYLRNSPLHGSSALRVSAGYIRKCRVYSAAKRFRIVPASGKIRLGTMIRGGFSIYHLNYFEN